MARLNRSFSTAKAAKDALKNWLREANAERKSTGQEPLRESDFKIVQVKAHPFIRSKR